MTYCGLYVSKHNDSVELYKGLKSDAMEFMKNRTPEVDDFGYEILLYNGIYIQYDINCEFTNQGQSDCNCIKNPRCTC